ncbi:hypothetical protein V5O48_018839 [Marasmius crinis-equi]|uniref:Uncharacterized protein n=1 Tax=Marasmius crinis-equi TaxID=585013 RepID=A0ABR3EK20_9AGAR
MEDGFVLNTRHQILSAGLECDVEHCICKERFVERLRQESEDSEERFRKTLRQELAKLASMIASIMWEKDQIALVEAKFASMQENMIAFVQKERALMQENLMAFIASLKTELTASTEVSLASEEELMAFMEAELASMENSNSTLESVKAEMTSMNQAIIGTLTSMNTPNAYEIELSSSYNES